MILLRDALEGMLNGEARATMGCHVLFARSMLTGRQGPRDDLREEVAIAWMISRYALTWSFPRSSQSRLAAPRAHGSDGSPAAILERGDRRWPVALERRTTGGLAV